MQPTFTVLTGPRQGESRSLAGGKLSIGRQADNDLPLNDPAVSRHHCVLRSAPAGLELTDLGSRHGTRVNGVLVATARLAHGDVVSVGETSLLVLLAETATLAALPLEEQSWSETAMEIPADHALEGQLASLVADQGAARTKRAD